MLNKIEITDEDISRAGLIMGGYHFLDDERSDVIKTMETCDVQACPGSGKTSALVAKLLILSRKLPDNRTGICVLSHTNAARDEITKHLAKYGANLLRYPHFIGTIQQFVDQFIAVPAMIKKFGIRPSIIDDDIFGAVAKSYFRTIPRKYRHFFNQKSSRWGNDGNELLKRLRYQFQDIDSICVYDNGKEAEFPAKPERDSFKYARRIKDQITVTGYIGFHDAFSLANWYLEDNLELSRLISSRFPLVFIDEMQDTDSFQAQIINKVFLDPLCVVQKLGDRNQTIYSGRSDNSEAGWQPVSPLPISHSYRLSPSIASLAQNVCQEPQSLVGNDQRTDRKHMIFLFENDQINEVLPAFAKLIIEEGLYTGKFNAVGYVKGPRSDDHLTISSYWPEFARIAKKTTHQESLKAYFDLARAELVTTGNCGNARNHLIAGMVQILRLEGIKQENGKWFSNQSFLYTLKRKEDDYANLCKQLLLWVNALKDGGSFSKELIEAQINIIMGSWLPTGVTQLATRSFLGSHSEAIDTATIEPSVQPENVYLHQFAEKTIPIEIDTIHGVKGQTHKATLVLDTYWNDYHLKKMLPYLKGGRETKIMAQNQRRLNLAYVAMTRPTDLLCLAMKREYVTGEDIELLTEIGWNICIL